VINLNLIEDVICPGDSFLEGQKLATDSWNTIGDLMVPVNTEMVYGKGKPSWNMIKQGRPFVRLADDQGCYIDGILRLAHSNSCFTQIKKVFKQSTERFRADNFHERLIIPRADLMPGRNIPWVGEDGHLILQIKPRSSVRLSVADSFVQLPITRREW